ncbi:unnamed protein product, partial [Musa acuminata subsp. burmannicoides]
CGEGFASLPVDPLSGSPTPPPPPPSPSPPSSPLRPRGTRRGSPSPPLPPVDPSFLPLGLSLLFLSVLISRSSRLTGVRSISLPVVHVSGDGSLKKRVVMPIAMELEVSFPFSILLFLGKKRFDMDASIGAFGTKEAPAVIEAYYDKRIVGCTGGDGGKLMSLRWLWHSNFSLLQDEHDLVWFWLEKGKPHECRVCSQYYV